MNSPTFLLGRGRQTKSTGRTQGGGQKKVKKPKPRKVRSVITDHQVHAPHAVTVIWTPAASRSHAGSLHAHLTDLTQSDGNSELRWASTIQDDWEDAREGIPSHDISPFPQLTDQCPGLIRPCGLTVRHFVASLPLLVSEGA